MTDLFYVVRHSWWFVFHIIKLQLPWGLIVVCTSQFLFPESVSVEIVSFKIKTNCFSRTNVIIFDFNWEKFSRQTHKPPLWRRVIWNLFLYLVWTLSLRSLPSLWSRRILPPSVTSNSNKRRQANIGYIYLTILQSRNGAEKNKSTGTILIYLLALDFSSRSSLRGKNCPLFRLEPSREKNSLHLASETNSF